MPYMSVELSCNLAGDLAHQGLEHRIDHDIESLLLVFLHIIQFTSGPKGNLNKDIYVNTEEFNVTQWHHEPAKQNIAHMKAIDILRLRSPDELSVLLPAYWKPIIPNIINLIDIVYPSPTVPLRTGHNIRKAFKKELEVALKKCSILEEAPHDYGTCLPYQTRMRKKRKASTQPDRRAGKSTRHKRNKTDKHT